MEVSSKTSLNAKSGIQSSLSQKASMKQEVADGNLQAKHRLLCLLKPDASQPAAYPRLHGTHMDNLVAGSATLEEIVCLLAEEDFGLTELDAVGVNLMRGSKPELSFRHAA